MVDITEQEIEVFVGAVNRYFAQITGEKAKIRSSFLAEGEIQPPIYDFTGLISLSGRYRGCIYFSATRIMLTRLLLAMQEPRQTDAQLLDAVGEIANTLAGNAREHFGEEMGISVPTMFQGPSDRLKTAVRERPYVIMIKWKQYEAAVIVDIAKK
ncbi:MAG: chemotaxis protein CheX [Proteobacteria bacterium]|nr:chemotaxis protein CheX [Pseudomonadota bacterium]MCL2308126.1 chemotaxis protein CheX [Pseudomonadota bacterium]